MASRPAHSYRRETPPANEQARKWRSPNAAWINAFKLAVAINVLACLLLLPDILGHRGHSATKISARSDCSGF